MGSKFNGQMLALARQLRKMSQGDLSMALRGRLTQAVLSKIEHGRFQPDEKIVGAFAAALHLRPSFFFDPSYVRMPPVSFHRRRQKLSARDLGAVHAQAEIYRINLKKLMESVELEFRLPSVPALDPDAFDGRVDHIAEVVRQRWSVPRGAVYSVTQLVEDAGVIVVPFDFGTPLIDGFSQHSGDGLPPIIFINSIQPVDRYRFSLAHELAHLVMHQTPNPDQELQANFFASEFLMPKRDIKPQLHSLSIRKLMDLKLHWGASMQALIYRAWQVGAISDRGKKYYFVEMSKRGFRAKEPIEIDSPEAPSTLRDLLKAHLDELSFEMADLSELFGLLEEELQALYPLPNKRPQLRLIV